MRKTIKYMALFCVVLMLASCTPIIIHTAVQGMVTLGKALGY